MMCSTCGSAMSAEARFCGACGATADAQRSTAPADDSLEPEARALCRRLTELARRLRETGTPAFLTDALDALAAGPQATGHLTAVVGEKGRGKTTLVNRLLGANALAVGGHGRKLAIALRSGPEWQIVEADRAATATTLPVAPGAALRAVIGPAPVLRTTTLLDMPSLNELDIDFEARVVGELVHADALLICVAANQLLSQGERDLIRHRLLPLLGGDPALVVTHMDAAETDDDRRDIHERARRFAGKTLPAIFLPPDPSAAPAEVLAFIEDSAGRRAARQSVQWRRKVAALLRGIEQPLAAEATTEAEAAPEPAAPSPAERLRDVTRLLESEHALALAEAESTLRQRLGALRMRLPDRVAHWTPDYAQYEGVSEISADVQTALRDAAQLYLSSLERSLTSGVPRSVELAAEHVGRLSPALGDAAASISGPGTVATRRSRDLRIPALSIAGACLVLTWGPVAAVAGAAALLWSHQLKRQRDQGFEREVRSNAVRALSTWIAASEAELIDHLRRATQPILASLVARVTSIIESAPPPHGASPRHELLGQLRACLALTAEPTATGQASEASP